MLKKLLSKKVVRIISVVILPLCVWMLPNGFSENILCEKSQRTIECAAKHPSITYVNEFQAYPVLDSALTQVSGNTCQDLKLLTATLTVASCFYQSHAHYSEELSELLNKLLTQEPECFMKATAEMDAKTRSKIGAILKRMALDSVSYDSGGMSALKQFEERAEYRSTMADFSNSQIDEESLVVREPLLFVIVPVLILAIIFALTEKKVKLDPSPSFLKSSIFKIIFFVTAVIRYVFTIVFFLVGLFLVLGAGLWLYDKNANSFSWVVALADLLTLGILIGLIKSQRLRKHIVKTWREIIGNM